VTLFFLHRQSIYQPVAYFHAERSIGRKAFYSDAKYGGHVGNAIHCNTLANRSGRIVTVFIIIKLSKLAKKKQYKQNSIYKRDDI